MTNEEKTSLILALLSATVKNENATQPIGLRDPSTPFRVGQAYLIRTATMIDVGRVLAVYPGFLVLEDAAWVADTGRFHNALAKGSLSEVEPFPTECIVSLGGIIDAAPWPHTLPLAQK